MTRLFFRSTTLVAFLFLSAFVFGAEDLRPVKYVFLFIGDGMSIPQRMLAEEYLQKKEQRGLRINAMPYQAVTTTRSASSFITDSAASGTAIACGEKTKNGSLGVSETGQRLESIAELAKKNGRKVGIITSVTINHATPAAFYAHNDSRGNAYDIGLDLIASDFDYFGGGGIDKNDDTKAKSYRGDLYELAQKAGYTVSRTAEEFQKIKPGIGKVLSVGDKGALPYAIDTPKNGLRLEDFTRQGIEMLQDAPKGFFMMVEGGAIDWACHANDAATAIGETLEFDDAVGVAMDFAAKHPNETLIVVTADHETGGMTLGCNGVSTVYADLLANQKASVGELGNLIKKFGKDNDVTQFKQIESLITEKSGLRFTADKKWEKGTLILSAEEEDDLEKVFKKSLEKEELAHGSALGKAVIRCLNAKAGVGWTCSGHTALPVSTTACGVEANRFSNSMDNTDIAKRLKQTVQ